MGRIPSTLKKDFHQNQKTGQNQRLSKGKKRKFQPVTSVTKEDTLPASVTLKE